MCGLGLAPDPDEEDLYLSTRQYPLAYEPEQDEDFQQHSKIALEELRAEKEGRVSVTAEEDPSGDMDSDATDDSDDDDNASGASDDEEDDPLGLGAAPGGNAGTTASKKPPKKPAKILTVVDKVCFLVTPCQCACSD